MAQSVARGSPEAGLPAWISPQLTQLVDAAPEGDQWLHEIKYDGYRMHAPARILPLYSPRPCFVLPASTYQSALLSSPTVPIVFFQEARNMASMQRVTNAEHAI